MKRCKGGGPSGSVFFSSPIPMQICDLSYIEPSLFQIYSKVPLFLPSRLEIAVRVSDVVRAVVNVMTYFTAVRHILNFIRLLLDTSIYLDSKFR